MGGRNYVSNYVHVEHKYPTATTWKQRRHQCQYEATEASSDNRDNSKRGGGSDNDQTATAAR